jgi:hypothetical protein
MIKLSEQHEKEFGAWNNATTEMTPSHIWCHAVELFAIQAGVPEPLVKEWHARIVLWGAHGESVEMAIETSLSVASARRKESRKCNFGTREGVRSVMRANDAAQDRLHGVKNDG